MARRPLWPSFLRAFSTTVGATTTERQCRPIKKLLIANRGEIAVRICRAAKERGIQTVGIYAKEDSQALHRVVMDRSFVVGERLAPVAAYLHYPEIIKIAEQQGIDAIHPGYGFLSENAHFAKAVEDADIMFIGPHPHIVHQMGDKVEARKIAIAAGVPVVPGTEKPIEDVNEAVKVIEEIGCPVMLKAAYGGGGRGMRRVFSMAEAREAFERATSEAKSAFGNGAMFVEKLIQGGRHIEVQIMGDHYGNVVHLFERDCTVQRRHQKVVEIAPAPFLTNEIREKILADAVKLAKHVGYQNAGTVEFLLDKDDRHYFIEVNARLQVEHTVTEQVTSRDLVKTQFAVREGATLPALGLTQDNLHCNGVAIQCRVTTEDSQRNFTPSTGRVDLYAPATGLGVRLDAALAASGAVITPHFDSLLVKVITSGKDFPEALGRTVRAMKETRIRGVVTNIPFILNVLSHEKFKTGQATVQFIDDHPELCNYDPFDLSSQNLCRYLAEVAVNGPQTSLVNPDVLPDRTPAHPPHIEAAHHMRLPQGGGSWAGAPERLAGHGPGDVPRGYKNLLDELGPEDFARVIRSESRPLLTDTTMRDAHQSLFATRMRTHDMLKVAPAIAHTLPQLFSLENWGGATFDVSYRFLRESPWKRLELLREAIPNIPFQMLLRGANAVGYTAYPDNAVHKFCDEAVKYGMDIFRIFDSLNYLDNLKLGIQAVGAAGGVVEAAISYTGNVMDRDRKPYTLDYYMDLARKLVDEKIHILAIKDMAGLLTPGAAALLVGSLRQEFPNMPIHVHTHDTGGVGVASVVAAAQSGADIVDTCMDSMSGLTSQPSMGAVVASLQHTQFDSGMHLREMAPINDYWEKVRRFYAPFDCTTTLKSGSSEVYVHEIPGGQYTNLHMQAWSLGMADKWHDIKKAYTDANMLMGDLIKVTPSSKVVGDMAQFMVQNGVTPDNILEKADSLSFPQSVVEFFQGYIGQPPFGFPEPLRTKVLKGAKPVEGRPGAHLPPVDWGHLRAGLEEKHGRKFSEADLVSSVMYPKVFDEYQEFRKKFGDVSVLPTPHYFVGCDPGEDITVDMAGREVHLKYIAKTHVLSDGTREVYFEVMGLPRSVTVKDQTAKAEIKANVKAETSDLKQIGAPMPGNILSYKVGETHHVKKGDPLVILSAMKMETVVVAPCAGEVASIPLRDGDKIEAGDLLLRLK